MKCTICKKPCHCQPKSEQENWKNYDYTDVTSMRDFFLSEYAKWKEGMNATSGDRTCNNDNKFQCCWCGGIRTRFVLGDVLPKQGWNTNYKYGIPIK